MEVIHWKGVLKVLYARNKIIGLGDQVVREKFLFLSLI